MTREEAEKIRERKKRCTYRALSEWYRPDDDPAKGMQFDGQDLCMEACEALGIDPSKHVFGEDPEFDKINKSEFGGGALGPTDYYWWD